MTSTKEIGALAEGVAEQFYLSLGYALIAKNFRLPCGEIDLIFRKGAELLFVEVKGRKNFRADEVWSPRWRVKKNKIRRTAKIFLLKNNKWREESDEIRFEIVFITHGRVMERFEEEPFF